MNALNPLTEIAAYLHTAWTNDDQLTLAVLAQTFTPSLHINSNDDNDDDEGPDQERYINTDDDDYTEDSILDAALYTLSRVFPDLYNEAAFMRFAQLDYHTIENHVNCAIDQIGIPYVDLHDLATGWLPIYSQAIDHYDELPEDHYQHLPYIELLNAGDEFSDLFWPTTRLLCESLTNLQNENLEPIRRYLEWLSNCTGNSILDSSTQDLDSGAQISWNPSDIAFAIALYAEAYRLLPLIDQGFTMLENSPALHTTLADNIQIIHEYLDKKGTDYAYNEHPAILQQLDWTERPF